MLYNTHQKYGQLSGLLAIPIFVWTGLLPSITKGLRFSDTVLIILLAIISMLAASFGAEFPDCDSYGDGVHSKGSIPAQKHPIISRIFRMCGVKHRGKFSHDYVSLGVFFGAILFATITFSNYLVQQVAAGKQGWMMAVQILVGIIILFVAKDLGNKWVFLHNGSKRSKQSEIMVLLISAVVITGALFLTGFLAPFTFLKISQGMKTAVFVVSCLKVFVVFTWVGAYSHLFADMMTIEGVWFAGIRVKPTGPLSKIPFIGKVVFKGFKTGSPYEDTCRLVVSILCLPALIFAVIALTGGDVLQVLRNFGVGG